MSFHAFDARFAFDARLRRLEEPLMTYCGFTWVGTETLFTVPISSQEGLGLVHASKMCPGSPQLIQDPVFSLC